MDFLHKNIKKNGVICLLLILDVCLLSSCKTNLEKGEENDTNA